MKNSIVPGCFARVLCAGLLVSASALAGPPPPKDTFSIVAETDTDSFSPTVNGQGNYEYAELYAPPTFADGIPVTITLTNGSTSINTYTISLSANGNPALSGGITFGLGSDSNCMTPVTSLQLTTDGTPGAQETATVNVCVSASGLSGAATALVKLDVTPPNTESMSTPHQIHLMLTPDGAPTPATCLITDSDGLQLSNCVGASVDTDGNFIIVTNGKKVTATNPGQFYYNLIWTNSSANAVNFDTITLNGTNVTGTGANPVHFYVYGGSGFSQSAFLTAVAHGIACGGGGLNSCKSPITVPAGQTIWLTWHIAYLHDGGAIPAGLPSYGESCGLPSASGTISVSGILSQSTGSTVVTCGPTTANGYTLR